MPNSVNQDTEYHWRNRFRLHAVAAGKRPQAAPVPPVSSPVDFRPAPSALAAPSRPPPSAGRWHLRPISLAVAGGLLGGVALFALVVDRPDGDVAATRDAAPVPVVVPTVGARAGDADFNTLLAQFAASREASLVALRGYLLTDSEGFHTEWREAVQALRLTGEAIERNSFSWTDGLQLVQLAEMKRLVDRLLTEQEAVAAMIGTTDRYPGLQLYSEDVRPALDEAQAICNSVLDAMLAVSSPEDGGVIDPFAKLRGDLEELRATLTRYAASRDNAVMPPNAAPEALAAMLATLGSARGQVPAALRPRIDRMIFLLGGARENLARMFALRAGRRWDYADYAFRTRLLPLTEEIRAIGAAWEG